MKKLLRTDLLLILFGVIALALLEFYIVGFESKIFLAVIAFIGAVRVRLFFISSELSRKENEYQILTKEVVGRAKILLWLFIPYFIVAIFMPDEYAFEREIWEYVKDADGNFVQNKFGGLQKEVTGVEVLYVLTKKQVGGFLIGILGLVSMLYIDKSAADLQSIEKKEIGDCEALQDALAASEQKVEELEKKNNVLTEEVLTLGTDMSNISAENIRLMTDVTSLKESNAVILSGIEGQRDEFNKQIEEAESKIREQAFDIKTLLEENAVLKQDRYSLPKSENDELQMWRNFFSSYIKNREFRDTQNGDALDLRSKRSYVYDIDTDNWKVIRKEVARKESK